MRFAIALCTSLVVLGGRPGVQAAASPAVKLRAAGDNAVASGKLDDALKLYAQALEADPSDAETYYRRFRVHVRRKATSRALDDVSAAIRIDPTHTRSLIQRGRLLMRIGRCSEAAKDFAALLRADPSHKSGTKMQQDAATCAAAIAQADELEAAGRRQEAVGALTQALRVAVEAAGLMLRRGALRLAEGKLSLDREEMVLDSITDFGAVLKMEPKNLEALAKRGEAQFVVGERDLAIEHWRRCLLYDPEHKACKAAHRRAKAQSRFLSRASAHMHRNENEEALEAIERGIAVDRGVLPIVHRLTLMWCEALIRVRDFSGALARCEEAAALQRDATVLQLTGRALLRAGRHEEAVRALGEAVQMEPRDHNIRKELHDAEVALKQSKEKDYYAILEVPRTATDREVKRAYRQLALKWHPDKHEGEAAVAAEAKFQEIAEAYEILGDTDMRERYDRGEDVDAIRQQQAQGGAGGGHHGGFHHFQHGGHQFHQQGGGHTFHMHFG